MTYILTSNKRYKVSCAHGKIFYSRSTTTGNPVYAHGESGCKVRLESKFATRLSMSVHWVACGGRPRIKYFAMSTKFTT